MISPRTIRTALLCCVAFGGLMLGGCGSSRSSVKGSRGKIVQNERRDRSGDTRGPASGSKPVNLSGIDDPMARDLIAEANVWIGTPYSYGGTSERGVDCSGLVMNIYRDVTGLKIPRTTREQARYCTNVARNRIRPGDLVFFANGRNVSHVGLYVGNGSMIHASSSRGVVVSDIDNGYWGDRFLTGGRVDRAKESWAALGGSRRGKSKSSKETAPKAPQSPAPESPARHLRDHGEMAATTAPAKTNKGKTPDKQAISVPVSEIGNLLATSRDKPRANAADEPASGIDLLDRIITEKTDSIFASQFLD